MYSATPRIAALHDLSANPTKSAPGPRQYRGQTQETPQDATANSQALSAASDDAARLRHALRRKVRTVLAGHASDVSVMAVYFFVDTAETTIFGIDDEARECDSKLHFAAAPLRSRRAEIVLPEPCRPANRQLPGLQRGSGLFPIADLGPRRKNDASNQSIKLSDGKYSTMHFTLGSAYFEVENWEFARQSFEKAAQLSPKDDAAPYNIALCMVRLGYYGDAANWYEEVLRRNPNHKNRQEILSRIQILRR